MEIKFYIFNFSYLNRSASPCLDISKIHDSINTLHKSPDPMPKQKISYGTAGFRAAASQIPYIVTNVGIISALRSMKVSQTIGIMITASHNINTDNGVYIDHSFNLLLIVKIVDYSGEMLDSSWEEDVTDFVNTAPAELNKMFDSLINKYSIILNDAPSLLIGYDNRESSPLLSSKVSRGASILNTSVSVIPLCTTPQLHWMIRSINSKIPVTLMDYYAQISNAFNEITSILNLKYPEVGVDCSNGVGARALGGLIPMLKIPIKLFNIGGVLNSLVGAEHVHKERKAPKVPSTVHSSHLCSLDGDVDRLVYFLRPASSASKSSFGNLSSPVTVVDGDKQMGLVCKFLKEICRGTQIGVIQTAYANGASTKYLNSLGVTWECASTGVKYLHAKAKQYPIGVYYESNGHGTVLFNSVDTSNRVLYLLSKLVNQSTGDAISNMLFMEIVLAYYSMSVEKWNEIYNDLPSKQMKVTVSNRNDIVTTNYEREVVSPNGLQKLIDSHVSKVKSGRAFVRPSGTENVVRIYAESESIEDTNDLAENISKAIRSFIN